MADDAFLGGILILPNLKDAPSTVFHTACHSPSIVDSIYFIDPIDSR